MNKYLLKSDQEFVKIDIVNNTYYVSFSPLNNKITYFTDEDVLYWKSKIENYFDCKLEIINYNRRFIIKQWLETEAFWVIASSFLIIMSILAIIEFYFK